MALPWLIGGAVAALVAYALSDDEKPNGSGSSSGSDDAERRRRLVAARERKERERMHKQKAALEDFQKQGQAYGESLALAMPSDLVGAHSDGAFTLDFDLKNSSMQLNMGDACQRDADLLAIINDLETILAKRASHQRTIDNLTIFSELYKPKFQYGAALRIKKERVIRLDEGIKKLKQIKTQLMRLENETAFVQAKEDTQS